MTIERSASVDAPGVRVGARFVFRSSELFGLHCLGKLPPFEGQVLTVVGFKPRYVNSVIVQDPSGTQSLFRPELVERALRHEQGQD